MKNKYQKMIGKILIISSVLLWILERLTNIISTLLGKLICGESYMNPVNGEVGDLSCGFNTDMHLSFTLVIFLIIGLILYISSFNQHISQDNH